MSLSAQLCACGCGKLTQHAKRTHSRYGHVKNQPLKYVCHHGNKNRRTDVLFRIQRKIKISAAGCHLWTGSKNSQNGYGAINIEGHAVSVVKTLWELKIGKVPEGLELLHSCDVRQCVNLDHTFLGTQKDNMQDMISKGRQNWVSSPGIRNGRAKLTETQVEYIKTIDFTKTTKTAIAKELKISRTVITDILKGKLWRCLDAA